MKHHLNTLFVMTQGAYLKKVSLSSTMGPGVSVDLASATYRNTIGSGELSAVWEDPEFPPGQRALYYARVLEIPTPRWTTFDAVRAGLPMLESVASTVQERAWSSPIWYQP